MPKLRTGTAMTNRLRERHQTESEPTPAWHQDAACGAVNPELFFPTGSFSRDRALTICASCPVKKECLDEALHFDDRNAIRGGLTATERFEKFPNPDRLLGHRLPDEVAVHRLMSGDFTGTPRAADRREAIKRMVLARVPDLDISEAVNVNRETVARQRRRMEHEDS